MLSCLPLGEVQHEPTKRVCRDFGNPERGRLNAEKEGVYTMLYCSMMAMVRPICEYMHEKYIEMCKLYVIVGRKCVCYSTIYSITRVNLGTHKGFTRNIH